MIIILRLTLIIYLGFIFSSTNHLIFSRLTITPKNAESVVIVNPTDENVDMSDYYLSDAGSGNFNYYNLPSGEDYWNTNVFQTFNNFIVQFPLGTILPANDSLIISLNSDSLFQLYYTYSPDLSLTEDMLGLNGLNTVSCLENPSCPFADDSAIDILHNTADMLILFKWDGDSNVVKDVDYVIWNDTDNGIDKTSIGDYLPDTPLLDQQGITYNPGDFDDYNSFSLLRVDYSEGLETHDGTGNGISGDDETSEDMSSTWIAVVSPEYGCTDIDATNYSAVAIYDDGTCCNGELFNDGTCCQGEIIDDVCILSATDIINNCSYDSNETIECSGPYDLSEATAAECPLYKQEVTVRGILVDYFDVTPYGGPHSFTISDEDGYRVELSVWPTSNDYQNGFDITLTDLDKLRYGPYGNYIIQATGNVGVFCDDDEILNINEEWDVTVEYEYNLVIIEEVGGYFVEDPEIDVVSIFPAPYVLIPSLGETLDFTFTHPENSRVTIRVFDLSGRFITTIKDIYMETAGTHYHGVDPATGINASRSAWDGRDHLGQMVSPGVYLMHIESYDYTTSKTHSDMAPVVVGVSN